MQPSDRFADNLAAMICECRWLAIGLVLSFTGLACSRTPMNTISTGGGAATGGTTDTIGNTGEGGTTSFPGGATSAGGTVASGGTTSPNPCAGQADFTPCTVVTAPDRNYDICVEGTCVSPGCGDATCNLPGPHFPLADTDQRLCYDNSPQLICPASGQTFSGQDAQYGWDTLHAESERFTRNLSVAGQPVVLDDVTGLSWQGCSAGLTGNACDYGSAAGYLWADALAYCDGLNWGGQKDWHLPDPYELQSIIDLGTASSPTIDTTAFPATPSAWFWSSSSYAGDTNEAWGVRFTPLFGDTVGPFDKVSNPSYVRCVRSGSARLVQPPRFSLDTSVTEQPVVVDSVTGLSWQGCAGLTGACATDTAVAYDWETALDYCANLNWGGRQNWRLPNATELRSIVDERCASSPTIDVTVFPNTPSYYFWSSSSNAGVPSFAWFVEFNLGIVGYEVKGNNFNVRCVRGEP